MVTNMKKTLCIALVLCALIALSACGGEKKPADYTMSQSFPELKTSIGALTDISEFITLSGESLLDYTGITEALAPECLALIPESSISGDMIFVIKAADEAALASVTSLLQSYRDGRAAEFKSYAPEEYTRLTASDVEHKGLFVWLVVSADKTAIENLISSSIG